MMSKHYGTIFKRMLRQNIPEKPNNRHMSHAQLMSLQEMPTPAPLPILGTTPAVFMAALNCRIHKYVDERHKELGSIFREKLGPVNTVVISDPNVMRDIFINHEGKYPYHMIPDTWTLYNEKFGVKRGLFFMNGEEWLESRRVMNKLLLKPSTYTWIQGPISQVANNLVTSWMNQSSTSVGYIPNLDKELYKLSLDVILAIMLGSVYSSNYPHFEHLLQKFSTSVHGIFHYSTKMYMMPGKFYEKLRLPSWRGFEQSVTESLLYGEQLVERVYNLDNMGDGLTARMVAEGLNKQMITRILIDMIIAAGDTTSLTTQWILYLLSKNPIVMDEFLKTAPSSEDEGIYVKGIIKESMRLYPSAAFITRILAADADIGGYAVPAGAVLVMSLYTSGRDERNFPDPLSFRPTRWNKKYTGSSNAGVIAPHASIPFAMGARSCIGRKIALTQMTHLITQILRNLNLKSLNQGEVEDIMQMLVKPKQRIRVLVQPRR